MPRFAALAPLVALCLAACSAAATPAPVTPSPSPAAPAGSSPAAPGVGQAADDGARIIAVATIDARTRDLTIDSPSVGTVKVRLLLPVGFASNPTAKYPVLYLLHGGGGEYTDWTSNTHVEAYTANDPVLVAMPAAASSGIDGWYTNWTNGGAGGPPRWETFHLTELSQLLERDWQASTQRSVAGLSLGGYGSIMYTARNPGFFKASASYSGVLDVTAFLQHVPNPDADSIWGDPSTSPSDLAKANPINLIPELKGTPLYISYGNGDPGPLDPPRTEFDQLEAWVSEGDDHFVAGLAEDGIPATVDAYGPGTHSWAYWDRELRASLPMLLQAVGIV